MNVGAMSVSRSVHTVSAILAVNSNRDIYFPRNPGAVISTREGFYNLAGFPKVLGAIDGSLVPIIAPSENEPVYVSRKGYHAINVQGIMNAELLFTNVVARWPGSTHDSFILLNSAVYTNFETGQYPDGWLLGDSGYSCKPWLLIPKLNPQTRAERAYNKSHIKTRNMIERGFGVWKMRFRCLHKSAGHLSFSPRRCANVIIATARLHNKCVRRRIGLPAPGDDDGDDDRADNPCDHQERNEDNEGRVVRERLISSVFDT